MANPPSTTTSSSAASSTAVTAATTPVTYTDEEKKAIKKATEDWTAKVTENEKKTVLDEIKGFCGDDVIEDDVVLPCGKVQKKKRPYCVNPSSEAGCSEDLK